MVPVASMQRGEVRVDRRELAKEEELMMRVAEFVQQVPLESSQNWTLDRYKRGRLQAWTCMVYALARSEQMEETKALPMMYSWKKRKVESLNL